MFCRTVVRVVSGRATPYSVCYSVRLHTILGHFLCLNTVFSPFGPAGAGAWASRDTGEQQQASRAQR